MDKKKKILLLSDDLRMHSGIATVSRQFVLGTVDKYDWVQLGAAIKHPEAGKEIDLSKAVKEETGVDDAYVKVYPSDGYGNADVLRQLIMRERPDAILHFTDPRYWIWLYEIAHEIREHVPILFYHIWDDLPDPYYNRNYYESCDWIGCISKQTYGIVKRIWGSNREKSWKQPEDWQISYVPHGADSNKYFPATKPTDKDKVARYKEKIEKEVGNKIDFTVLWVNRNIRRKMPGDIILAFKEFADKLTPAQQKKCVLLMHTVPIDNNGTDLIAVKNEICPDLNVVFSNPGIDESDMNVIYNLADVCVNIANNEGFGLTTCEALMAGTPTVVNVTGGLQDQCGFKWVDGPRSGEHLTAHDYVEIGSLHNWKKWEDGSIVQHGPWTKPVWPKTRSLNGSPPTPYIFCDIADYEDVADKIHEWYKTPKKERIAFAKEGREWLVSGELNVTNMCNKMSDGIETGIKNWKPLKRFEVFEV